MLAGRLAPAPMLPGETLAQYRATPAPVLAARADAAWSEGKTRGFPLSWVGKLMQRWRAQYCDDAARANRDHLAACTAIAGAQRAGLSPDANDAELCEVARQSAREAIRRKEQGEALAVTTPTPTGTHWRPRVVETAAAAVLRLTGALWNVAAWLRGLGLGDAVERIGVRAVSVFARLADDRWWRRLLRKVHARAVEGTARGLGIVHKRAGCYVSDDGLWRRAGQQARNAKVMADTRARNEHGQEFALAELAARGPSNREIRRHELMTRIAGFELIAKECNHVAYFVTITCPSRMHAMRTAGPRVEPNPRFDGTRPDQAQQYLTGQWARARAHALRKGLDWYGFRIAEPNHDGTPHWHALFFFPRLTERGAASNRVMVDTLRRYFLFNDSPDEPGADRHRIKVERIDPNRGSAAGYVAKYVAKNIDGYRVERDLYGNDAITSSRRVEAWAATWRVRQFQQIGGAPVTVWRELRRLHPEQEAASPGLALALEAVNITESQLEHASEAVQRYTAAHGWATYTHLQGGPRVRRAALRLRLLRDDTGELSRYGEPMPGRVAGVELIEGKAQRVPALGIVPERVITRSVRVEAESERASWTVLTKGDDATRAAVAQREARRPWSPVNNCTQPRGPDPVMLAFAGVERHRKKGRWARFTRGKGATSKEPAPCPATPAPSPPN